jgi:hypothetical protein
MDPAPPLLDAELAEQFFASSSPEDEAPLRDLLAGFRGDAYPRFANLGRWATAQASQPTECQRELHQLRGVVANFGFSAAAQRLRGLEHTWRALAAPDKAEALRLAHLDMEAGIEALQQRYPYLRGA